jgi:hypothetical protein
MLRDRASRIAGQVTTSVATIAKTSPADLTIAAANLSIAAVRLSL